MGARTTVTTNVDQGGIESLVQPGGVLYRHAVVMGETVATVARLKVGVDTGRLRQSISSRVIVRKTRCVARVSARPRYAYIHHEGRRAIRARPGKVLRFRAKDGTIVYTRRVKAVAGNPFLTDAVREVTGKTPRRRDAAAV